jgi:hypothetical protein
LTLLLAGFFKGNQLKSAFSRDGVKGSITLYGCIIAANADEPTFALRTKDGKTYFLTTKNVRPLPTFSIASLPLLLIFLFSFRPLLHFYN